MTLPTVKFELPDVANEALKPVSTNVGNTLSSLWNLIFGFIDVWAEKKQIQRSANLDLYKTLTEEKFRIIKEENLQELKMNIVGPALESSKYYFEEEHYREMFSNLISAAADKTFNNSIHTSFSNIITQLSPRDADMLKQIFESEDKTIPCVELSRKPEDKESIYTHPLIQNILLKQTSYQDYEFDQLCLDNLVRLNLITIDYQKKYTDDSKYNDFNEHPIVSEYKKQYKEDLIVTYGLISSTTYGSNFMTVCLR